MPSNQGRIDVHHHLIPPSFTSAMTAKGLMEVAGAPLPSWSPEASIENMDAHGIAAAILSLSAPGTHIGTRQEAIDLARACNEFSAETAIKFPGRFGSFAVLPMPFTEDACKEAIHALDVLGADGVVLLGSTDGIFLGDPRFNELMAELDRRKAIVFEHPNLHPSTSQVETQIPGFLVEFLCDTTRAATNLIFSGTLDKYPNIRWILSHAGGFLPYIAWRLSLANAMPSLAIKAPRGVLHYLRNFYYDTALSPSPYAMAALKELVEPDHILFGSDFPFAPSTVTGMETAAIAALPMFDEIQKDGINRQNALKLFPKFSTSTIPSPSLSQRIRHSMQAPIEAVVDKIRDR